MEPYRERWPDYHRNNRGAGYHRKFERRSNDFRQKHDIHRNSKSRNSFKWRNNCAFQRNFRSSQRKNETRPKISEEDAEEQERRKKLSDAANKLLSKIKTWSAENSANVDENKTVNESDAGGKESEPKIRSECVSEEGNKPKRIAHSKKKGLVKKKVTKNLAKTSKLKNKKSRYEVNKATVKDFQNRIQHKLINEIMQMPKENLQNVLNDPKINPVMEFKMSCLVRENKHLIAQKLRAMAESKMASPDSGSSSQLLLDIDKLIDPVIETDLSVLPYELIKQMENIFQVQFDYSNSGGDCQSVGLEESCGVMGEDNVDDADNVGSSLPENNLTVCSKSEVNTDSCEDLGAYECSTDEDEIPEEEGEGNSTVDKDSSYDAVEASSSNCNSTLSYSESGNSCKRQKLCVECFGEETSALERQENLFPLPGGESIKVRDFLNETNPVNVQQTDVGVVESEVENSKLCDSSTQTTEENLVYGVSIPREAANDSPESLLEEVKAIQTLINKLSERRMMIFLQLAKSNPSGDLFTNDSVTRNSFTESISNGNMYLVENLTKFFDRNKSGSRGKKNRSKKQRFLNKNQNQGTNNSLPLASSLIFNLLQ